MSVMQGDIYGFIGENGAGKNNNDSFTNRTGGTYYWQNCFIR